MALILAVEPDRHQASQLAAIARGRLRAELVIEGTAERALAALGDRVPDLILTAALLSPKDEAALAERLRALDSAAAHVHTLTIPVLAAPRSRPRIGGMLSALRRDKSQAAEPDGCDPAVFAEQCATYLERAVAERDTLAADAAAGADQAAAGPDQTEAREGQAGEEWHQWSDGQERLEPQEGQDGQDRDHWSDGQRTPDRQKSLDAEERLEGRDAHEEQERSEGLERENRQQGLEALEGRDWQESRDGQDRSQEQERAAAEDTREASAASATADGEASDPLASLAEALREATDSNEGADTETVHTWEPAVLQAPADPAPPSPMHAAGAAPIVEEAIEPPTQHAAPAAQPVELMFDESPLFELVNEAPSESRTAEGDDELDRYIELDLSEFLDQSAPILHTIRSGGDPAAAMGGSEPAAGAAAEHEKSDQAGPQKIQPAGEPDESDWLDVVEGLRRDVERLDAAPVAAPWPARPVKKAPAPRKLKGKPVQDEWGFFDPEQCGFAALLAKLDEVTRSNDPAQRRRRP